MTTGEIAIMVGCGAVFIIMGILFLVAAKSKERNCTKKAMAEIIDVKVDTDEEHTFYAPVIRYTVDGKEYTKTLDKRGSSPTIGDWIDIKVNPKNPMDIIKGKSNMIFSRILLGAGIFMILVVVIKCLITG